MSEALPDMLGHVYRARKIDMSEDPPAVWFENDETGYYLELFEEIENG